MYPPFPSRPLLHWDCSPTLNLECRRNRWPIRQSNIMERTDAKKKVPFICTYNAVWSQMAEGFLQALRSYIVTATKHTVQALSPPDSSVCCQSDARDRHWHFDAVIPHTKRKLFAHILYIFCVLCCRKLAAFARTCDQLRTLPQINA